MCINYKYTGETEENFWRTDMRTEFKHPELEDKEIIRNFLQKEHNRNCEMTFANIYLWSRTIFPLKYAIVEDTICFLSENEDHAVTFPVGAGDKKKVIELLKEEWKKEGRKLKLRLVTEEQFLKLQEMYGDDLEISYNRDYADYVYETEKLIQLSGKKYHGKKNHINRFIANHPNWQYEPITKENVAECIAMAEEWGIKNGCDTDKEKQQELSVTIQGLNMLEELDLKGGLIRAEGQVIAFTFGESVTDDTFVIHVEKAFAEIQGAYPMINREFLKAEAAEYLYVNREEDTGSEGLRKAKLSYHPAFLIEKGFVTLGD